MRKTVLSLVVVALALVSFTSIENDKKNDADVKEVSTEITFEGNIDTEASVLYWKGTKPTGSHNGTVKLKEGSLAVKRGKIKSGSFTVDMSTIKDADGSKRLEGHLMNADFFDVEKYPTSTFVIKSAKLKGGKVAITGDLTIKGNTKSITIPATLSEENGVTTLRSDTFEVNRAEFNVRYGSKSFFDNLKNRFIDDMMEFSFVVKTKK